MAHHRIPPALVHQILAQPIEHRVLYAFGSQIPQAFWSDWFFLQSNLLRRNDDWINFQTMMVINPLDQESFEEANLIESEIIYQHFTQFVQDW